MSENLVEKYATKTYIDKDYKDIVVSEKSFVNLVQENKKQKEVLDKIKEIFKNYGVKEDIVTYSMYRITGEEVYTILELLEEIK